MGGDFLHPGEYAYTYNMFSVKYCSYNSEEPLLNPIMDVYVFIANTYQYTRITKAIVTGDPSQS